MVLLFFPAILNSLSVGKTTLLWEFFFLPPRVLLSPLSAALSSVCATQRGLRKIKNKRGKLSERERERKWSEIDTRFLPSFLPLARSLGDNMQWQEKRKKERNLRGITCAVSHRPCMDAIALNKNLSCHSSKGFWYPVFPPMLSVNGLSYKIDYEVRTYITIIGQLCPQLKWERIHFVHETRNINWNSQDLFGCCRPGKQLYVRRFIGST